ncbi:MAG: hypothetical protein KDD73_02475 [Anaerolineales bacterium]|nr:hypothetical protein [Anaerolineales bacterium]MCB9128239.1 hypothetical protein [Ardenticatenales bacterium]
MKTGLGVKLMEPQHITFLAFALIARLFLGGYFLLSAFGKLRDMSRFVQGTLDYRVLPTSLAKAFALLLPWIEIGLATMFLSGFALQFAGGFTLLLLIAFTAAIFINLRRGRKMPCNCYGLASSELINWGTIARNLLLMVFALIVALHEDSAVEIGQLTSEAGLVPLVTISLILILLACCYLSTRLVEAAVDVFVTGRKLSRAH